MGKLIEVFTEIFKNNYKNPRFYLVLISLLMVVFVLYPYIDANFSYYGRMNDRVNVLKQLTTIDQDKIKSDSRLKDEYDDILSNIQSQRSNTFSGFIDVGAIDSNPAKAGKFISGAALIWIIGTIAVFSKSFSGKRLLSSMVIIFIGALFGLIGLGIPSFSNRWVNYIGFPVLQIVLVIILAVSFSKKKKTKNQV